MFRWALLVCTLAVLGIVAITFVSSRGFMYYRAYYDAVDAIRGHEFTNRQCEKHSEWRIHKPNMCREASFEAARDPSTVALEYVLANTHSCGQWQCSDLYALVLAKTNDTFISVALAAGLLALFYALALRLAGSAYTTASAKSYAHLAHAAPSYLEDGAHADTYYAPLAPNMSAQYVLQQRRPLTTTATYYTTPEGNQLRILNSET